MRWENTEYRNREVLRLLEGLRELGGLRPNKCELTLLKLLEEVCPGGYKYTGDGSVMINGLCPDFTNCNGQKKVVEMFGEYWHRDENPQDRIRKFMGFGFNCLVVWEGELRYPKSVIRRMRLRRSLF